MSCRPHKSFSLACSLDAPRVSFCRNTCSSRTTRVLCTIKNRGYKRRTARGQKNPVSPPWSCSCSTRRSRSEERFGTRQGLTATAAEQTKRGNSTDSGGLVGLWTKVWLVSVAEQAVFPPAGGRETPRRARAGRVERAAAYERKSGIERYWARQS